jgi:putative ABC transport system permease protein
MRAVIQKIKADILHRPVMSFLIVATIFASSTLLTLAVATLMHLSDPYDRAFESLNAAHVWLFFDRDATSRRDIERIKTIPGVVASTGLRYAVVNRVELRDNYVWTSLRAIPESKAEVNRLFVQEGTRIRPGRRELLASKDLDDLYNLEVGETITVTGADHASVAMPVVGLAYNPMWDTYRNSQPPYLYVSEETLRWLYPDESSWQWSIGLRLTDPETVDETVTQIEMMLHDEVVQSYTDWRDVKRSAVFGAKINFIFLGAFSLFAILATILVIASSIGSIVLSQFRQIGILKTLGFTSRQILSLYLGQYLVLGLIGSPLGFGVGALLAPLPLRSVAASLDTEFRPPLNLTLILLVLGLTGVVITLATLSAARRGAHANIIRAIAVGAETPNRVPTWATQLITYLRLPVMVTLGINDLFVKPFRSLLTGLNLMLGVIGIVFGLTLSTTLDTYQSSPELLGIAYDAAVTRHEISDAKTDYLLRHAPGVEAVYEEYLIDAETLDGKAFQVRVVQGDLEAFPFEIPEGRFFQPYTYEAIAGRGLLDWLGLKVGDALTVTVDAAAEKPMEWHIVGQYTEPVNVGQMMMVPTSTMSRWVRHREPETYFLRLAEDLNPAVLRAYMTDQARDALNITLVEQALPDAVRYLQLAIYALSGILIGIALINVFNTTLLATKEKTRTFGVLKTIGMTPPQVMTIVYITAGVLGLLATMTGIPLGVGFTRLLLGNLSSAYGFGEVKVSLNVLYAILLIPLMLVVSIIGSLPPSFRAAKLSIVEVLRNE